MVIGVGGWAEVSGLAGGGAQARPWVLGSGPLDKLAVCLLVLNLLDALFTMVFLQLGIAEEANPLLRRAYAHSPTTFVVLKAAAVSGGLWVLWWQRRSALARAALWLCTLIYVGVLVYHLGYTVVLAMG
jgi:hypothetical protein